MYALLWLMQYELYLRFDLYNCYWVPSILPSVYSLCVLCDWFLSNKKQQQENVWNVLLESNKVDLHVWIIIIYIFNLNIYDVIHVFYLPTVCCLRLWTHISKNLTTCILIVYTNTHNRDNIELFFKPIPQGTSNNIQTINKNKICFFLLTNNTTSRYP